jgi:hypothetical protein
MGVVADSSVSNLAALHLHIATTSPEDYFTLVEKSRRSSPRKEFEKEPLQTFRRHCRSCLLGEPLLGTVNALFVTPHTDKDLN